MRDMILISSDQVPNETEIVRVRGRDPWQAIQSLERTTDAGKAFGSLCRNSRSDPRGTLQTVSFSIREAIRTIEAWYYQPDIAKPWIRPAVQATVKLCSMQAAGRYLGYCRAGIGMDCRPAGFANNRRAIRPRLA